MMTEQDVRTQCARCGTYRPIEQMTLVTGAGWACELHPWGVSCAMQLTYRGYGEKSDT